jgi:FMN phosphatase YigB (HAD superfamily)
MRSFNEIKMKITPKKLSAILFDLDGTLLNMDFEKFVPQFYSLFAQKFSSLSDENLALKLMEINNLMKLNDGTRTNFQLFKDEFYPIVSRPPLEIDALISDFFQNDFNKLRDCITEVPHARVLLELCFDRGYDVVIATNPIFPKVAAQQRLYWVGLDDFDYKLIAGYETSSAAKPNLIFFEEILTTIKKSAHESLMVGDMDMDMIAAKIGCPTFWISNDHLDLDPSTPPPTYSGSLVDLYNLIQ